MKRSVITAIFLISFALSAPAADYEVTIDGKAYLFTEDIEQQVAIKNGQRVAVTVSILKVKEFREHGISFRYPSHAKITRENIYGIQQITLETTDSPIFLLQIYPGSVTPKQVQQDLLTGFREEFSNMGAKFPGDPSGPCQRNIGGKALTGVRLSYSLSSLPHETEIYTIKHDGKTIAMIFQHAHEDKTAADPLFSMIAESFK